MVQSSNHFLFAVACPLAKRNEITFYDLEVRATIPAFVRSGKQRRRHCVDQRGHEPSN